MMKGQVCDPIFLLYQLPTAGQTMLSFHASGIGGAAGARRSQSVVILPSHRTTPCKFIGCALCLSAESACMVAQLIHTITPNRPVVHVFISTVRDCATLTGGTGGESPIAPRNPA